MNLQWEYSSPNHACITLIYQGRFRTRGVDKYVIALMEINDEYSSWLLQGNWKGRFDSVEETGNEM